MIRDTRRGDRGAVVPLVALLLPLLIVMTAIAIDLGRQRADRRLAQSGADVVALDMIRIVQGRTLAQVVVDPATTTALTRSATRNGFANGFGFVVDTLQPYISRLEWGEITSNTAGGEAFVLLTDPARVPTAVQITAERTTDYFFQPGQKGVTRLAIATEDKQAHFLLGTRLASVNSADAALLNAVLGDALNGAANISLVGYQGLVGSTIGLGALAAALGFGSPDELANATVNARQFYLAAAQVMTNGGNTAGASVFQGAATTVNSTTTFRAGDVIGVQQGGGTDAANAGFNAFDLLTGSAYAINGASTINVPSIAVSIPNVTAVSLSMDLTERAQRGGSRVGATASTRQANVTLNVTLSAPLTALLNVTGTIPLRVQLAGGTGTLTAIDCGRPGISVSLAPRPVTSTQTMDLSIRTLLNVQVARATGTSASVTTQGTSNGASFLFPSEFLPTTGTGTMRPSNSTSLGLANASSVTTGNITVLGVLPLGTTAGTLATALNTQLNPILAALDDVVVNQLNRQLGLSVGGADIGAEDMTCRSVKLVG